ncbi:Cytochrome c oxidase subunit 3 [Microbacterium sp. MM2322]
MEYLKLRMGISGSVIAHNGTVTTSATYSQAVRAVKRPDPVAVGTIVWLGSEVMFFAGLFAIYFTLRSTSAPLWAEETQLLNVPFATVNTIILVLSSVTCQMGVFAAERYQPYRTGKATGILKWGMVEWFYLTFILGAVFVSGQVWEYATLVAEGMPISANPYASAFYITTGFHALHVTGGLIAFLLVIGRAYAVKNFGRKEMTTSIVVSYYWHFVDVVWIALFFVIYFLK